MKKITNLIVTVIMLMVGVTSHAASSDIRCVEYSNLIGKIVMSLDGYKEQEPGLDLNLLNQIHENLICLPVKKLSRQAYSFPKTLTTHLLADSWGQMTYPEKVRLALHELFVLATYERDGEYSLSNAAMQFLIEPLAIYGRKNKGLLYPDGSVAFPAVRAEEVFVRGNTIEDADSLCKFLGLGKALKFEVDKVHTQGQKVATLKDGMIVSLEAGASMEPQQEGVDILSVLRCSRSFRAGAVLLN